MELFKARASRLDFLAELSNLISEDLSVSSIVMTMHKACEDISLACEVTKLILSSCIDFDIFLPAVLKVNHSIESLNSHLEESVELLVVISKSCLVLNSVLELID